MVLVNFSGAEKFESAEIGWKKGPGIFLIKPNIEFATRNSKMAVKIF